jgi:hypothetical protein
VRWSSFHATLELSPKGSVVKEGESKASALVEVGWLMSTGLFICATEEEAQNSKRKNSNA